MEHENLGCTSLVQHSINTADSPPIKQPHRCVQLAKREEMRLPLDLATGRLPGKELPQMAPEFVVALQQQMEATRRQVLSNLHLVVQAMTRWYQLRARDAQYAVGGPHLAVQSPQEMSPHSEAAELLGTCEGPYTILQRLLAVTYKLGDGTSRRLRIVCVDRLWAAVEEGHFTWGQQGPPSSPDSEVEGEGGINN
ncbi:hypothetical protein E2C01_058660 [Portunus trituberculatus]|uniref:Uncharacterized protein n=1 Tax=Portunus trituberculatus TaxID=210409 RepID=A0A5B7H0F4_PORTR|nr:hypothetical protein [Portunus trituberculatus]